MSAFPLRPLIDPFVFFCAEQEAPGDVLGVWAQTTRWTTHVFVLSESKEGVFHLRTFAVNQADEDTRADLNAIYDALDSEDWDESLEADSAAAALMTTGQQVFFLAGEAGDRLQDEWDELREDAKVASMSKYARKRYMAEKYGHVFAPVFLGLSWYEIGQIRDSLNRAHKYYVRDTKKRIAKFGEEETKKRWGPKHLERRRSKIAALDELRRSFRSLERQARVVLGVEDTGVCSDDLEDLEKIVELRITGGR